MAGPELDKSDAAIRTMFAGVAPRYDLLNHLLSGSLDRVWRRRAVREVESATGRCKGPLLDLCCGTGDQATSLIRLGDRVLAADFCLPMLARARAKFALLNGRRPSAIAADALLLPFAASLFSAVTISFGVRNMADLDRGLESVAAVLEPGGRLIVLEFAIPRVPVLRPIYLFYLRRVLPFIGRLLSPRGSAYAYLRDSVEEFPQRQDFVARLEAAGLEAASWRDLSAGTVCLYSAQKPPPGEEGRREAVRVSDSRPSRRRRRLGGGESGGNAMQHSRS